MDPCSSCVSGEDHPLALDLILTMNAPFCCWSWCVSSRMNHIRMQDHIAMKSNDAVVIWMVEL
jgi:hypothetical protein